VVQYSTVLYRQVHSGEQYSTAQTGGDKEVVPLQLLWGMGHQ
jgi:hypothetical protein